MTKYRTVFVSDDGNDEWDGSNIPDPDNKKGPVRTVSRALEILDEERCQAPPAVAGEPV